MLHTPLAALAAEARTRRRVAADFCVHVAGNRNCETEWMEGAESAPRRRDGENWTFRSAPEVAGAGSLEDVVPEGATVGPRGRAVVRSPSHAADRDADLHHGAGRVERVAFDDDIFERAAPRVVVDRVDTAERAAGSSDDRVAGDDGAGRAKDDDTWRWDGRCASASGVDDDPYGRGSYSPPSVVSVMILPETVDCLQAMEMPSAH